MRSGRGGRPASCLGPLLGPLLGPSCAVPLRPVGLANVGTGSTAAGGGRVVGIGASATAKDLVKRREMAAAVRMAVRNGGAFLYSSHILACEKTHTELHVLA